MRPAGERAWEPETVEDRWPDRLRVVADLIPSWARSVIDVGAGAEGLEQLLGEGMHLIWRCDR